MIFLLGCIDQGINGVGDGWAPPGPAIEVVPESLRFYEVEAGAAPELSFEVRSVGRTELVVSEVVVDEGGADYSLPEDPGSFTLQPGENAPVSVRFSPTQSGERLGTVLVRSDDEERPEALVDLSGTGLLPRLEIIPGNHDFGEVGATCGDSVDIILQNTGLADLVIDGSSFEGSADLSLVEEQAFVTTLGPMDYVRGRVDFSATTAGAQSATLRVSSNDPEGEKSAIFSGTTLTIGEAEDVFITEANPELDIVLAIDRSASMDDEAMAVGANFQSFLDIVSAQTSAWHLGVVTMDSGCFNGGVLKATTPNFLYELAAAALTGTDAEITADERLLYLAHRALTLTDAGECNAGFRHAGAPLSIIVVSDEPERSTDKAAAWTWDYWVTELDLFVDAPELLTISGVIDLDSCGSGAAGYEEAIAATSGTAISICTPDWESALAELAHVSLRAAYTFELSSPPIVSSIVVTVDGTELASGWRYDAGLNAVVFDSLDDGAEVRVTYSIAGGC